MRELNKPPSTTFRTFFGGSAGESMVAAAAGASVAVASVAAAAAAGSVALGGFHTVVHSVRSSRNAHALSPYCRPAGSGLSRQ